MATLACTGLWINANILLFWAARDAAKKLFTQDDGSQQNLHALVLWYAWLVLAGTVLGICDCLTGKAFVLLTTASAVAYFLAARLPALVGGCPPRLVVGGLLGTKRLSTDATGPPNCQLETNDASLAEQGWPPLNVVACALWIALGTLLATHVTVNGLLTLPLDWDSLNYHLPLIDSWLQQRSLYVPRCAFWANPGNNELIGLWLVAPFSGDFLAPLMNLPAVCIFALATHELARILGLRWPFTGMVLLAVLLNRVVLRQLVDAENDLGVAAWVLVAFLYILRHLRSGLRRDMAMAGLAMGILAGIKYYALGYVAVLCLCAALASFARLRRWPWQGMAMISAGLLLWSGYWYGRNTLHGGTPLFPMKMGISADPLTEIYPNLWQTTLLANTGKGGFLLLLKGVGEMGGASSLLALALLPFWAIYACASAVRGKKGDCPFALEGQSPFFSAALRTRGVLRRGLLLLLLSVLLSAAWLCVVPFMAETRPGTMNELRFGYSPARFGLAFLALCVVGFAVAAQDVAVAFGPRSQGGELANRVRWWRPLRWLALAPGGVFLLAVTAQAVQFITGCLSTAGPEFIPVALIMMCTLWAGFLLFHFGKQTLPGLARCTFAGCVVLAFCGFVGYLENQWSQTFDDFYDRTLRLDGLLQKTAAYPGPKCILEYRLYPFLGARRDQPICQPLTLASRDWLLHYIWDQQAVAVVVVRNDPFVPGRFRHAYEWLAAEPQLFRQVRWSQSAVLMIVDRDRLEVALGPEARVALACR